MRFAATVSAFLGLAACVCAETIVVKVGESGSLAFSPESVTAKQGDVISFQFLTKNHTLTQSTFDKPCVKFDNGADSGFLPVSADATEVPQFSFTVDNATAPLWFYCKQGTHCQAGMVFAVNPTAEKTFDAFKAKAVGATGGTSGSSSSGSPSSTASGSTPSASNNTSGAFGTGPSAVAGFFTLVAVLAGSVL